MKGLIPGLLSVALVAGAMVSAAPAQGTFAGQALTPPREGDPATVEGVDKAIDDLNNLVESLVDRAGLTAQTATSTYNDLANELDRATITLSAKRVREKSIQSKLEELTSRARQQMDRDETLKQLTIAIAAAEKNAERSRSLQEKNLLSQEELDKRVAEVVDAKVRLEERREAITAAAGGGALSALNKELIAVSLDVSEQEVVVDMLNQRMNRWREARNRLQEIARLTRVRNYMVNQQNRLPMGLTPPPSSAPREGNGPGNSASSPQNSTPLAR